MCESHTNMSQLDTEIALLREKLAVMEERRNVALAIAEEKKANPLKTLEDILEAKRARVERNRYSKSVPLARFYDQEKIEMMEPILALLKNLQERIEVLEAK